MIEAEELLKPISADEPCGKNIASEPAFLEMETMMRGKEETQFSPAEPPNWKKIRERSLELWKRSKDLRLAIAITVAELELEGLEGFRNCLALVNGLTRTYWKELHPQLVESEGNDPAERINTIANLTAPVGTYGDLMRVIERVRKAPLTNSPKIGKFTTADILRSKAGKPGLDGKPPPTEAQIKAAFGDTKKEELERLANTLSVAGEQVAALEENLTKAVGADKSLSLEILKKEIEAIYQQVAQNLPELAQAAQPVAASGVAASGGEPLRIAGEIQSRQDAVHMLDKICGYYDKHEPSSPVPFLLKRAKRLAEKNFMEIINDLSPDALPPIQKITGEEPKTEAPPA